MLQAIVLYKYVPTAKGSFPTKHGKKIKLSVTQLQILLLLQYFRYSPST